MATPHRTREHGRYRAPEVLGTAVTRTAGLALDAVARLRSPALRAELDHLRDLRGHLAHEEPKFSDLVHEIVPGVGAAERRSLLRMRRDVHNGRVPRSRDVDLAEQAVADVPEALRTTCSTLTATRELADTWTRVEELVEDAARETGEGLAAALSAPALARGLSLVNPVASRSLHGARARDLRSPGNKKSRTALTYTVRTALKPSPLSTLTSLRVDHPHGSDRSAPEAATARAHVSDALVLSVLHACLRYEGARAQLRARPNRSLRHPDEGPRLLVPMFQHLNGAFFWRRDDVVDASEVLGALTALDRVTTDEEDTAPVGDFVRALPPGWTFRRALEAQLLIPATPWEGPHQDALTALAETLSGVGGADGTDPAEHLWKAADVVSGVPSAPIGERSTARREASAHLRDAFVSLDAVPPAHTDHRDVLYEDTAGPGTPRPVPETVHRAAGTAAGLLSRGLFRSSLHDDVVRAVREATGVAEGPLVVDDVMALLHGISRGDDAVMRFQTSAMRDTFLIAQAREQGLPAPDRPVAVSPSTAGPMAFAVLQQARGHVVLDQALLSGPGQLARYRNQPGGDRLHQDLRRFCGDRPGVRVVEVGTAADQNSLQRAGADVLPRLVWPVESLSGGAPGGIDISELRLSISGEDRVLLTDQHGVPVVLRYSGVVPMTLISGPVRNLLALAHPWALAQVSDEDLPETVGPPPKAEQTRIFARTTVDGLVTGRRTVSCAPASCPLGDPDLPLVRLAADLDLWLADHGLPQEVYLRVASGGSGFERPPKPLWVAVDSPHSLETARREAAAPGARELRIVEASPGSDDTSAASDGHLVQHAHLMTLSPNTEQIW